MPIRLAIVDDYEVVVRGLAEMLRPYGDEFELVPLAAGASISERIDVALVDPLAGGRSDGAGVADLVGEPHVDRVVLYSWNPDRSVVEQGLEQGAVASLAKTASADELVEALRRVHAGDLVAPSPNGDAPEEARGVGDAWPGREHGLTARESQVIALITQGLSNQEIAEQASLSINSVKSYIRSSYRKMGVASRTNAVLWGLDHGFAPHRPRVDDGLA